MPEVATMYVCDVCGLVWRTLKPEVMNQFGVGFVPIPEMQVGRLGRDAFKLLRREARLEGTICKACQELAEMIEEIKNEDE